jgi:hypothetical protein
MKLLVYSAIALWSAVKAQDDYEILGRKFADRDVASEEGCEDMSNIIESSGEKGHIFNIIGVAPGMHKICKECAHITERSDIKCDVLEANKCHCTWKNPNALPTLETIDSDADGRKFQLPFDGEATPELCKIAINIPDYRKDIDCKISDTGKCNCFRKDQSECKRNLVPGIEASNEFGYNFYADDVKLNSHRRCKKCARVPNKRRDIKCKATGINMCNCAIEVKDSGASDPNRDFEQEADDNGDKGSQFNCGCKKSTPENCRKFARIPDKRIDIICYNQPNNKKNPCKCERRELEDKIFKRGNQKYPETYDFSCIGANNAEQNVDICNKCGNIPERSDFSCDITSDNNCSCFYTKPKKEKKCGDDFTDEIAEAGGLGYTFDFDKVLVSNEDAHKQCRQCAGLKSKDTDYICEVPEDGKCNCYGKVKICTQSDPLRDYAQESDDNGDDGVMFNPGCDIEPITRDVCRNFASIDDKRVDIECYFQPRNFQNPCKCWTRHFTDEVDEQGPEGFHGPFYCSPVNNTIWEYPATKRCRNCCNIKPTRHDIRCEIVDDEQCECFVRPPSDPKRNYLKEVMSAEPSTDGTQFNIDTNNVTPETCRAYTNIPDHRIDITCYVQRRNRSNPCKCEKNYYEDDIDEKESKKPGESYEFECLGGSLSDEAPHKSCRICGSIPANRKDIGCDMIDENVCECFIKPPVEPNRNYLDEVDTNESHETMFNIDEEPSDEVCLKFAKIPEFRGDVKCKHQPKNRRTPCKCWKDFLERDVDEAGVPGIQIECRNVEFPDPTEQYKKRCRGCGNIPLSRKDISCVPSATDQCHCKWNKGKKRFPGTYEDQVVPEKNIKRA